MADVSHRDQDGDLGVLNGVASGYGSPEGVLKGELGALYRNRDGGVGTTFYVKQADPGEATGWAAYTSAEDALAAVAALQLEVDALDATVAAIDISALETRVDALEDADTDHEAFIDAQVITNAAQLTVNGNLSAAITAVNDDLISSSASLDGRLDAIEANDWVTTARINARAVTFAEFQAIAASRILGRVTSGSGDVEELTAADVKTLLAIAAGDVSGLATVATTGSAADLTGTLAAARIADGSLDKAKIANIATSRFLGRTTASSGPVEELTAASAKTLLAIAASDVSGLATVATSGSAADLSGTLAAARLPAMTGDVTASAGSHATTIANDAVTTAKILDANVTNAKLANMGAATIKGSVAGGVPADLTATQATALLNVATTSVKGLAPILSNDATQFLNGSGAYTKPVRHYPLMFGVDTVTAGTTGNYLNPIGLATTPAGTAIAQYRAPFAGTLVLATYLCNGVHTTNTVVIKVRINGVLTTIQTLAANVATQSDTLSIAIAAGDSIGVSIDHNGATNARRVTVGLWVEY